MLTRAQKVRRASILGAFGIALVWGTVWGNDVHFPFGPFRMYSTSTKDEIAVMEFHGVTPTGEILELPSAAFGLRRAEFEGQRSRFIEQPQLLAHVLDSYEETSPQGPRLTGLRLVHAVFELVDGRPVYRGSRLLAEWEES